MNQAISIMLANLGGGEEITWEVGDIDDDEDDDYYDNETGGWNTIIVNGKATISWRQQILLHIQ